MFDSFKKHLSIYRAFFRIYLKTRLVYYKDVVFGLLNQFFSIFSSILLVGLLFTQVDSINGWGFWELIFLVGVGRFIINFHTVFFFAPVFMGEHYIVTGRLDRYFLRPLNILYQVYASRVNFHNLGDAVASLGIMAYAALQIQTDLLTPVKVLYSVLAFSSGLMVVASIFLVLGTLGFWTGRTGALFGLFWKIREFRKYPLGIYSQPLKILFVTLVPIAFSSFFQASFLLERFRWLEFQAASLIAGPVFYLFAYRFWLHGRSNYTSTGS